MTMGTGTSAAYQRALLLLQQNRPRDAEREFRQVLVHDPRHAMAHAMLARCLTEQDRFDEAQQHAGEAIGLMPDEPMVHYVMSLVLFSRNRYHEAGRAIEQAIRLDPNDPDLQAMLAQVLIQEKRWKDARIVADRGLALDPGHVGCSNLRAIALVHLGEREAAGQTIEAALQRNPENPLSHANQGWTLLHQGQHVRAMEHFREALRLDPDNDWARAGIVEALKARHIVYRIMLRYFLFMSRMSAGMQWGIIIGLWVLSRVLSMVADANPAAAPYVRPIVYGYVVFAVLTWLSPHLFNLLLRLSRFGRYALSAEQRQASTALGSLMLLAVLVLIAAAVTRDPDVLGLGICTVGLLLPLAGAFHTPRGWPRWLMLGVTTALAGVALVMFALAFGRASLSGGTAALWQQLLWIFVIGVIGSQFLANILAAQQVRR